MGQPGSARAWRPPNPGTTSTSHASRSANNQQGNGNDFRRGNWDNQQGNWNNQGNFDKGPWWANNRHDWWDDRQGPPPWGWGPPPAYQWAGGPPRPFNYWGYDVNPVWDNGFHQWGIWLFGLWIPIFGIG